MNRRPVYNIRGSQSYHPSQRALERRWLLIGLHTSLCLLSMVLCWVASSVFPSPAWSWMALVNFVWIMLLLLIVSARAAILILPVLIQKLSIITSLILIEYGNEMPELGTVGHPGPYNNAFVFYIAPFILGYLAVYYLLIGRRTKGFSHPLTSFLDKHANVIVLGVFLFVSGLTCYLILRGLLTGFPLLQGTDRFLYRRFFSDWLTLNILNYKFIIAFLLGVAVFATPADSRLKMLCSALGAFLLLLYFLFADKFFTQLNAVAAFFAPYVYRNSEKIWRDLFKYATVAFLALGLVFAVTWSIYSNFGAMTTAESSKKLAGRLTGQGELWYLQSSIGAPLLTFDWDIVSSNLEALLIKDVDLFAVKKSLGPNYFSNKYAPDDIRSSIMSNGGRITYTAALEPLALVAFGWVGLGLILVGCGALVAIYASYMAYAIANRSVISAVFAGFLCIQLQMVLTQGTPWVLFSLYTFRWQVLVWIIEIALLMFARVAIVNERPRAYR